MSDVQILAAGSESIPYAYTVPNTQEVIPKAVSAIFDGTGAAAAFLPVLEIVSDAGIVVAQSPATQVAAGGSAEVSWFPRVGVASASTGLQYAFTTNGSATTITAGSTVYSGGGSNPTRSFYTNAPDVFTYGFKVAGGGDQYGVKLNSFGNYMVSAEISSFTISNAGNLCELLDPDFTNTGEIAQDFSGVRSIQAPGIGTPAASVSSLYVFDGATFGNTIPSDPLVYRVKNHDLASVSIYVSTYVYLLPGTTATDIL